MRQIVLFSVFRRARNRALFCVSSCAKSCSFLRIVVRQIVLFSAFRRAPNRAFFCVSSRAKSRSFKPFFRAPNRAHFCVSSWAKSCSFLRLLMCQIVLFSALARGPNRVFFRNFFSHCSFGASLAHALQCMCIAACSNLWISMEKIPKSPCSKWGFKSCFFT